MARREDRLEYHTNKLGHAYCHTNSITPDDFSNNDLSVGESNLGGEKNESLRNWANGEGNESKEQIQEIAQKSRFFSPHIKIKYKFNIKVC